MFTLATSDANPDNYATWDLNSADAGDYLVEVYTAKAYAAAQRATYTVRHGARTSQKVIDQTAQDGWQSLGTFAFARGAAQSLRLDDNTGEAVGLKGQLGFDAIRVTRAGDTGADGGGVGTGGDAGPRGDAGPASASGGPSGAGASDLERLEDETGGCQIRAGATSPEAAGTGVLALALAALGRRRRRAGAPE